MTAPSFFFGFTGTNTRLTDLFCRVNQIKNGVAKVTLLSKTLFAAAIGTGVLAFSAMNASAAVVCSGTTTRQTPV